MRGRLVRERVEAQLTFFSIPLSVLSCSMSVVEKKKDSFLHISSLIPSARGLLEAVEFLLLLVRNPGYPTGVKKQSFCLRQNFSHTSWFP